MIRIYWVFLLCIWILASGTAFAQEEEEQVIVLQREALKGKGESRLLLLARGFRTWSEDIKAWKTYRVTFFANNPSDERKSDVLIDRFSQRTYEDDGGFQFALGYPAGTQARIRISNWQGIGKHRDFNFVIPDLKIGEEKEIHRGKRIKNFQSRAAKEGPRITVVTEPDGSVLIRGFDFKYFSSSHSFSVHLGYTNKKNDDELSSVKQEVKTRDGKFEFRIDGSLVEEKKTRIKVSILGWKGGSHAGVFVFNYSKTPTEWVAQGAEEFRTKSRDAPLTPEQKELAFRVEQESRKLKAVLLRMIIVGSALRKVIPDFNSILTSSIERQAFFLEDKNPDPYGLLNRLAQSVGNNNISVKTEVIWGWILVVSGHGLVVSGSSYPFFNRDPEVSRWLKFFKKINNKGFYKNFFRPRTLFCSLGLSAFGSISSHSGFTTLANSNTGAELLELEREAAEVGFGVSEDGREEKYLGLSRYIREKVDFYSEIFQIKSARDRAALMEALRNAILAAELMGRKISGEIDFLELATDLQGSMGESLIPPIVFAGLESLEQERLDFELIQGDFSDRPITDQLMLELYQMVFLVSALDYAFTEAATFREIDPKVRLTLISEAERARLALETIRTRVFYAQRDAFRLFFRTLRDYLPVSKEFTDGVRNYLR